MSELMKISVCPELSLQENEMVVANSGTKIKVLSKKEISSKLIDSVSKAYWQCKYATPSPVDLKLMADELAKDVSVYFTKLTIEEVDMAFRNGCRKVYGDFAGISNAVMFTWLQNYVMSTARMDALKKQREYLDPPPEKLTTEQKLKIIHDGCLQGFEEFKAKGSSFLITPVSYDYLDSKNVFQWAKGRKFDFIRQAQEILKMESQNDLLACKDDVKRIEIRNALHEVNNAKSNKVLSKAKTIALTEYFSCLVEIGMELSEKINEYR